MRGEDFLVGILERQGALRRDLGVRFIERLVGRLVGRMFVC